MIPYVVIPDVPILGPLGIHPFGVLVAAAVVTGFALARRRARAVGIREQDVDSLAGWVLIGGFAGAHLLDRIAYHLADTVAEPWTLFAPWVGLSSTGGFIGGIAAGFLWRWRRKTPLLPIADVLCAVLPVAWIFGRAGCAVVHDHPGIATSATNPLGVAFPDGPRYDLGLLEMLFAVALSIGFAANWRRQRPQGWYVSALAILYAPARFVLDFLRTEDERYGGLTPAQWGAVLLLVFGLFARHFFRRRRAAAAAEMPSHT